LFCNPNHAAPPITIDAATDIPIFLCNGFSFSTYFFIYFNYSRFFLT
jgi:hypothetical protein